MPDENALIAHLAGISPREFRDRARLWCLAGDAEAIAGLVATVNATAAGLGS